MLKTKGPFGDKSIRVVESIGRLGSYYIVVVETRVSVGSNGQGWRYAGWDRLLVSSAAGDWFRSLSRTRETETERENCRWHPWRRWRAAFGSVADVGYLFPVGVVGSRQ